MRNYLLVSAITAFAFLMDSCARNPVTGKRQLVLMSEEQEIAMGREADPQIIAQYGLYPDSALQNFINAKGKQMAAVSHRSNLNYEFRVLDTDVLNAFAIPGGYVYFTRGIMAHFNNEAEFAGVLGHEIGHITARHSVSQQSNALLGQIGLIATMVLKPELGQYAQQASEGLGLLFLKFGRDDERQSDQLGVEYSSKIGYDAHEMADFFNTLQRKSEVSGAEELPGFLSTHPNPGERLETVHNLAKEWQQKLNLKNPEVNRNAYLRRIDGLIYGEDPRQGFLENNVFYHPQLKFQFPVPANWAYANSPQNVQMAPKDGSALLLFTLAPGSTLQEAAANMVKQNNLQVSSYENTTVNGLNAIAFLGSQVAQQQGQQQSIQTLNYIIQYGGVFYYIAGVASSANFNTYVPYFNSTMTGFRPLTDAAKLNRQPKRVRIKTISSAGTLQQALQRLNVNSSRFEEMAILNGMNLQDQLPSGTMVKVVE